MCGAVSVLLAVATLAAADSPEVTKLKKKVAELEAKVEALTHENEQLKEELSAFKVGKGGAKPEGKFATLPIKQEVMDVEYELVRCWMNGDRWQLDFYVTNRKPKPYLLTFRKVIGYDYQGGTFKIEPDFIHPNKLTTDVRTKVTFSPGTLSAEKYPVLARLELYPAFLSKTPLLFKDLKVERPAP